MNISDKVALITGGASGLGLATAEKLLAAGSKIMLVDLNEDNAKKAAESLGDGAAFAIANVTDEDSVGFCSIPYHSTQEKCEDAGGTWTEIDVDTDFSKVDTSALTDELAKQIEELDKCFADPILKDYLVGL